MNDNSIDGPADLRVRELPRGNPYDERDVVAKAWDRGYIAGREGLPRSSHAYRPRAGRYRRAWGEGWEAGLVAFRLTKVAASR